MAKEKLKIAATNPKIKKPAYEEGEFVILKRDYIEIYDFRSRRLTKGAYWIVGLCGCSKYEVNYEEDTGRGILSRVSDEQEWCYISKTLIDEDGDETQACVRAKDLELFTNSTVE